jgi:Zn-dependent alcohol dehydrogenase
MRARILTGWLALAALPLATGCASPSKTAQGAGVGGAIGAGTGALIGSASGHTGKGALIGGLVGAGLGGLIGNEEDQKDKRALQDRAINAEARAAASAIGIDDVVQMTLSKQSEDVIINQIRTTNSTYQLTAEDLRHLSTNGVSDRVIMEMQNRRPEMQPRTRLIAVPQQPVYVIGPPPPPVIYAPPPPPSFGVGVHIRH